MSLQLSPLQQKLCDLLQQGLPIVPRPFAQIGQTLGCSEEHVLEQTKLLKDQGVIRRLGPVINYRTLGFVGTLVTASVPKKQLTEVAEAVNTLWGVSHNYLRAHHYNLWFTLLAQSPAAIERILTRMSEQFGIHFHSLPVIRPFKLDVRFGLARISQAARSAPVPLGEKVDLTPDEKEVLKKLQESLQIVPGPFDSLATAARNLPQSLTVIQRLIDKGVVRRLAAVLDHRKLGFVANALFCCRADDNAVVSAGRALAKLPIVSHCYQRQTFEGWPHNLFAMMHARAMADLQKAVDAFTESQKIADCQLLPTVAKLRREPVKFNL